MSSSGVGVPNSSAKSVGAGRTSASFGNGLAAKGGVWKTPGTGGCVAAPERPPPPTDAALGPTRGGGKGPGTGVGPETGGAIATGVNAPTPGVASDAGGTSPGGDPPGETDEPEKNSLAMRETSPTMAAKSKADAPVELGSIGNAPPRGSLVLMVVADIYVLQHGNRIVSEYGRRAVQRHQVRGRAAIVDAHPTHGQARAHLARNARLE